MKYININQIIILYILANIILFSEIEKRLKEIIMQVDNELNIEILETGTDKDYIYVLVLEKLEDKKIITQAHKLYNRSQKRYIVLVRNFLRNKVNCLVIRKELNINH